ncbi:MAG: SUMF1/EgtB/PvdO family nonheme iron enzyme, partial [Chloroflexota bacterium]
VWEWTADWYRSDYFATRSNPDTEPPGPSQEESNGHKTLRGGSFRLLGAETHTTDRNSASPDSRLDDVGFRCVF